MTEIDALEERLRMVESFKGKLEENVRRLDGLYSWAFGKGSNGINGEIHTLKSQLQILEKELGNLQKAIDRNYEARQDEMRENKRFIRTVFVGVMISVLSAIASAMFNFYGP